MNHQNPTLTFYLGQGSDSQARIISRQIPKSPRTWIVISGTSGDRWRYLNFESWEGQISPKMVQRFAPRTISPESFLEPWLDSWACDYLLIDELPVRSAMHPGALKAFAALAMRRSMNIHMALIVGNDMERQAFEDFVGLFARPADLIRFWVPNQNLDLRYLRLSAKSWIDLPQTDSAEVGLSNLLCLLHQRPREIGLHP